LLLSRQAIFYALEINKKNNINIYIGMFSLDDFSPQKKLRKLHADFSIDDCRIGIVIHPELYELVMVDNPPVSKAEMEEAIKYSISDVVPYPVHEAIIGGFRPPIPYGDIDKRYVSVMKRTSAVELVDEIKETHKHLEYVGISELAICHSISKLMPSIKGIMVLSQLDETFQLIMIKEGNIYLIQKVNECICENEINIKRLALECQRFKKLYKIQMGEETNKIIIPEKIFNEEGAVKALESQLEIPVETITSHFMESHNVVLDSNLSDERLIAFGGLEFLREMT
jgi:hypothetical protein